MKIGVIGGGQLGRMLGLAGLPLGMRFTFLDPGESPCAAALGEHRRAAFDDADALQQLASDCDVVTFEFENIPAAVLQAIDSESLRPSTRALHAAQERQREKLLFEEAGIPVAPWRAVNDQQALDDAIAALGLPLIAKTRTLGYDGKGQARIHSPADAAGLFEALGATPLLVERLVDFDQELSVIGSRALDGTLAIYPLTRNWHSNGILHRSETLTFSPDIQRQATRHFKALCETLDYVGTLAIEFFVKDGLLLGNEFAPRVHNSGHWTQDGATHSQFENHLRAIAGLPLGDARHCQPAGMLNLIGQMPERTLILKHPLACLHRYQKAPRPGRKIGHINVVGVRQSAVSETLDQIAQHLPAAAPAA